jgi:hypothetical protein
MKKDTLIELLNSIPGNPEIKLYNGFVRDWMNISSEIIKLREVKPTYDTYKKSVQGSPLNHNFSEDEMRKSYRNSEWSINDFVYDKDIKNKVWKQRKVIAFEAKRRGKYVRDRAGKMSY